MSPDTIDLSKSRDSLSETIQVSQMKHLFLTCLIGFQKIMFKDVFFLLGPAEANHQQ